MSPTLHSIPEVLNSEKILISIPGLLNFSPVPDPNSSSLQTLLDQECPQEVSSKPLRSRTVSWFGHLCLNKGVDSKLSAGLLLWPGDPSKAMHPSTEAPRLTRKNGILRRDAEKH